MKMGPLQLLFFFISSILFSNITSSQEDHNSCITYCSGREPFIQFPFSLHPNNNCGYPGFTLACNSGAKTILRLVSGGDFLVREIDYRAQQIRLYDPDNCLPKRLLNLSNTRPFQGFYYRNYTFLNCSAASVAKMSPPIRAVRCLSSEKYTVLATYSRSLARYMKSSRSSSSCEEIATVEVPVSLKVYDQFEFWSELDEDVLLKWGEPDCGECVVRGGRCGFALNNNSTTLETQCFNVEPKGLPRGIRYLITLGVGVPALMCAIGITCYIYAKVNPNNGRRQHVRAEASSTVAPQSTIIMVGLDEPTIESYPKTVLGESRRLPKPDDNTCPICLSEYRPKETLRTIPDCSHCFHADCIDEWLRINASCPLCRNSQAAQSPLSDAI